MKVYLISYDLDIPGQDYHRLITELERLKAVRVLYSVWVFKSASSAVQIRDHLRKFTDGNDMLLAAGLTGEAAWTQLMISIEAAKQALAA